MDERIKTLAKNLVNYSCKVKAGDKVAAGDIIGSVTSIPGECADQSHLHFEITKDGHSAEPLGTLGLK